jgi:hypothetical protein
MGLGTDLMTLKETEKAITKETTTGLAKDL